MSKPSPEAKQAAEIWVAPVEITSFREAYAYGYDAATAKLREKLAQARENLYSGLDRDRDDITTPHLATVAINALTLAREQLAHQQPSVDVNEGNVWKVLQPSAPTPERKQ